MNDSKLKEFEAKAVLADRQALLHSGDEYADDVPKLLAEIRRLRAACVKKDEALELAYRLVRHARSAPGHTPLVHLAPNDAALLETLLTYATSREELGTICEDCRLHTKGLIMKSDHHGGVKIVCIDRKGCNERSPG